MRDYKDILVGFVGAIIITGISVLLVMGIGKTEPSIASENANRFTTEKVIYNGSTGYLITDTKTGAEVFLWSIARNQGHRYFILYSANRYRSYTY